ncbi:hypothetical protein [Actinomadura montaniterrae]|uniref:Uncharacterized protein n=2 Tax=Actinomadura montaniterrae TaxID=1803903 RepID=A0A6L3VTM5_9ACTN|nr:hypothetical protein [Actinomadura montaniterrae]KAB2380656.1 hypothetical protein F9B16_17280 [Actinomadura montaniterrae]
MDPITLEPNPAGGHCGDYTLAVAGAIAEAVRVLNYATLPHNAAAGAPYPSTLYDIASRLRTAAAGTDQLFRQMEDRLTVIAATREITVSHGPFPTDPAAAVARAVEALQWCNRAASMFAAALADAHNALSPLGVRIPADPDDAPGTADDSDSGEGWA